MPKWLPRWLPKVWQQRGLFAIVLLPLALLMGLLVAVRRFLYRHAVLRAIRLPVPVIVVGNITVGGAGKTPLALHLIHELRQRGRNPGVISRGYRRDGKAIAEVDAKSDPAEVGDEPVLIHRRSGVPVFVGSDRAAVGQALLKAYPAVDLLISDDGLQHYRLARDFEIAVFDARGTMNGWLLPAGPLREPVSRLKQVDALVFNAAAVPQGLTFHRPAYRMQLQAASFYRLGQPDCLAPVGDFSGPLHALAGIGNPRRFFAQLAAMGLECIEHPFPDHHSYVVADLPNDGRAILTTEKDAVKLARLLASMPASGALPDIWVLPVSAHVEPDLVSRILEKIDGSASA